MLELLVARRCVLAYLCSDGSSQLAKLLPILVFAAGRHRSPDSWQGKAVVRRAGQVSTAGALARFSVTLALCSHTTTALHTPTQCLARLSTVALEACLSTPWCDQGRSLAWVERLAFDREASVRCSGYLVYAGLLRCVFTVHTLTLRATALKLTLVPPRQTAVDGLERTSCTAQGAVTW